MSGARRLEASMVASALLHGLVLGVVLRQGRVTLRPPLIVIPVALVARAGGGGGAPGPAAVPAPAPAPEPAAPPQTASPPRPTSLARKPRVVPVVPAPSAPAESGAPAGGAADAGAVASRGAGGGGDGSGGDGSGGAHAAYGSNPLPPYPMVARRLGKEGVVLLEVLVAADGHAADVRVLRSSGFAPLDESAATTVRERWRFVPAQRDGVRVDSRVTVLIRFRLSDEPG